MFPRNGQTEEYSQLMENLMNENCKYIKEVKKYKVQRAITAFVNSPLKELDAYIINRAKLKCRGIRYTSNARQPQYEHDYINKNRIAVYTCVFGKYDELQEPLCLPDNVDYWYIGDQTLPQNTLWKKLDIDEEKLGINKFSPTKKNRFVKMNPQVFFRNYKYSLYIDGNIKIFGDITAEINRISTLGFSCHRHPNRDCVYEELETCLIYKKIDKETREKLLQALLQEEMTRHYGLLECNVLAREHNNPICKEIDQRWWDFFEKYGKRDQLWLPVVLMKMGIPVEKVCGLGYNLAENYMFRVENHK